MQTLLRMQDEKQNLGAPELQAWNTEQPRSVLPRPYATCLTIASAAINLHILKLRWLKGSLPPSPNGTYFLLYCT